MVKSKVNIFIFRRDLRIQDNTSLNKLIESDPEVPILFIFIFSPTQIDPRKNEYFNKNAVEFMVQSLKNLDHELDHHLYYFEGHNRDILNQLIKKFNIHYVAFNRDFTPYALERDYKIKKWCKEKNIEVICEEDYTLYPLNHISTGNQEYYKKFTPYYTKAMKYVKDIREPSTKRLTKKMIYKYGKKSVRNIDKYFIEHNYDLALKGGRDEAMKIINNKLRKGYFANYKHYRAFPIRDKTTKLSPYIKFGCLSIREVFYFIKKQHGKNNEIVRSLFWKEFYNNITFNEPKILQAQINKDSKNMPLQEKYNKLRWTLNEDYWKSYQKGKTGIPFVDAGIRELITTGWVTNRLRMLMCSFAVKNLLIDPNIMDKWFAQHMMDYCPSANINNVQWCSSVGVDSQPYFRSFNPYTQGEKYDKETEYIKKWVPELKNVLPKDIHNWNTKYKNYDINYSNPIVDTTKQFKKFKKKFMSIYN